PPEAAGIMMGGLSLAAEYVAEGKAIGLKSGRPHYETTRDLADLSNEVLLHAFSLAGDLDCAVQVHAESGPCEDMVGMAKAQGMNPARVVKHFGTPETPLIPSLVAKHEAIPDLCRAKREFTMESDYMDENSRPGAVIGPKSVPRFTLRLLEQGHISEEDLFRIHMHTPRKVYGIGTEL
ncbi:TatD family hydrolase, partial [Methanospirillum sp.]|uniref:TatD family hydrolase n=1 Tax=Methanospirillum sp. TaxID=45200 RepID=UPI002C907E6D